MIEVVLSGGPNGGELVEWPTSPDGTIPDGDLREYGGAIYRKDATLTDPHSAVFTGMAKG